VLSGIGYRFLLSGHRLLPSGHKLLLSCTGHRLLLQDHRLLSGHRLLLSGTGHVLLLSGIDHRLLSGTGHRSLTPGQHHILRRNGGKAVGALATHSLPQTRHSLGSERSLVALPELLQVSQIFDWGAVLTMPNGAKHVLHVSELAHGKVRCFGDACWTHGCAVG